MDKIIVFTDIHITPEGEGLIGLDPAARFAEGLAHALRNHPDAAGIVISGDLTHRGAPAEYARLRELLSGCPLPVSLMLGNHDRRAPFLDVFPDTPVTTSGFVQQTLEIGRTRLILMDTLDESSPGLQDGYLCQDRLDWLDSALSEARLAEQRVILFTHHPPILTGFDGMDSIGLRNRTELVERLRAHGNVVQIISGHIHRTISGSAGGIPTAVFKSPCHQMPMLLHDSGHSLSVDEPGAYGILLLTDEAVIVHSEDFTLPPAPIGRYDSDPSAAPGAQG